MFKRRKIISAFDIEHDLVKLAQAAIEDNRSFLLKLTAVKIEPGPEGLKKAVRRLASENRVASTRAIVNLPRHRATVRHVVLPSVSSSEIEGMVALQAVKQLPFSPDSIITGYRILKKDEKGYSEVMITLAQRDVVEDTLKVFFQAGIDVEALTLSSEAVFLLHSKRLKDDEKNAVICAVDIGRTVLEIQVIREGILDFTRCVSIAPPLDPEARIVDEIKKSLYTYAKNSPGPQPAKLVLTGRRSAVSREGSAIKKALELPTVYIDTLRPYEQKEDAALPPPEMLEEESFTAVLSLAFNCERLETNLIPKEVQKTKATRFIKERLIMTATLSLSLAIGLAGIAAKNFFEKKRFLASIEKNLEETKPKVENLSRLMEITETIKKQTRIEGSSIDVTRELFGLVPPEISLAVFDYDSEKGCLLRGSAQGLSDVVKFVSVLEESLYFESVKFRYATKRAVRKQEVTDFEITCLLSEIKPQ